MKKRNKRPLDLALVIGLTTMIKRIAQSSNLALKFHELAIIAKFEKGPRRQAIKHIMATMTPRQLGLRLRDPKLRGLQKPMMTMTALFAPGRPCPKCHKGVLCEKVGNDRKTTACNNCKAVIWYSRIKPLVLDPVVIKEIDDRWIARRKHDIVSHWWSINDPAPPRYAAQRAA